MGLPATVNYATQLTYAQTQFAIAAEGIALIDKKVGYSDPIFAIRALGNIVAFALRALQSTVCLLGVIVTSPWMVVNDGWEKFFDALAKSFVSTLTNAAAAFLFVIPWLVRCGMSFTNREMAEAKGDEAREKATFSLGNSLYAFHKGQQPMAREIERLAHKTSDDDETLVGHWNFMS